MQGSPTADVPPDAARPAEGTRVSGTAGTAWTLVVFFVGAALLSIVPGVPTALRPLDASTQAARASLLASVIARPRVTLVEHERRLAGEVDKLGAADEDTVPDDDVDDVDGGVAHTDPIAPPVPSSAAPRDRAAFLDSFPPNADELAVAATHQRLAMPGGVINNPCVERDASGVCRRTALDPLFSTLDALVAGDPLARADIVVLGNSLIASDHVVDVVRRELVARFGDGGRGLLLPERLSKIAGRRVRTGRGSPGWTPRTFALDKAAPEHVFGLSGSFHEAAVDGESTVWAPDGATIGRLRWLDDGRPIRVDVDGTEVLQVAAHGSPSRRPRSRTFRVPAGAHNVRLVAGRGARVVDVVLERDTPGVIVDTIGVPAASARGFVEQTDAQAFVEELAARDPALIVTILGGNETRSMAYGQLDDATFADALTRLLERAHAAAPRSACLVVSPIDAAKTTTGDDRLVTRPEVHRVIDVERQVASAMGCGFFDLFAAMGGDGSLGRLRDAGLISDDLVHPRARGGDLLGALLSRALLSSWPSTAPAREPQVSRRHQQDAGRPRFAGLSFPEEDKAVVVNAEDDDEHAHARPRALARFFARLSALEDGRRARVAIGQFGASHTAGQMLTDRMRQRLGARFGEVGRGYISAGTASNRLTPSGVFRDVTGDYDVADGREVGSGGAVGMAGPKLRLAPGSRFRVGFCKGCPLDSTRTKGTLTLSWLYTPDMGVADVFLDGVRIGGLSPGDRRHDSDVQRLVVPIAAERATLDVVVRSLGDGTVDGVDGPVGPVHLLSVAEEMDRRGIVLDAAGLPGTTGMTAQRWRQDLLAEEVRARDYDLVITAWGTNEAGIRSLDEQTYRRHFGATLDTLLGATAHADCLIIGATDRFDRHDNELVPAPSHELVERAQRAIAAERGCAFYSLRTLMGGPGSMRRWVDDGLARSDYVHFTREGYARLADAIIDDLLAAYAWSGSDPERDDDDDAPVADAPAVRAPAGPVVGDDAAADEDDTHAVQASPTTLTKTTKTTKTATSDGGR